MKVNYFLDLSKWREKKLFKQYLIPVGVDASYGNISLRISRSTLRSSVWVFSTTYRNKKNYNPNTYMQQLQYSY